MPSSGGIATNKKGEEASGAQFCTPASQKHWIPQGEPNRNIH